MESERLCDSEYRFMQLVWDNAPIASGDLARLCGEALGWKKSTTYTVLKKLCDKGIIKNETAIVTVLLPRERVTAVAAVDFVDRAFGGSLPGFLTAFMQGKRLTASEAEALTRLIKRHQEV